MKKSKSKSKIILSIFVSLIILGNIVDVKASSIEVVKNSPLIIGYGTKECESRTNEEAMNHYFSNPSWSLTLENILYDGIIRVVKFEGVMKENFLPAWKEIVGNREKASEDKITLVFGLNSNEKWEIKDLRYKRIGEEKFVSKLVEQDGFGFIIPILDRTLCN